jgi:hypothetical protein
MKNPGSQGMEPSCPSQQAACHSLPFQCIPKLLMIHIVLNAVKMINVFPTKGGISETLSPKTIMSGETLDYKKHASVSKLDNTVRCMRKICCTSNSQSPRTS